MRSTLEESDATAGQPANSSVPTSDRTFTVGRIAAVAVLLVFAIMWIYVLVNTGKYHPAQWLADRTFPNAAEQVCASALKDLRSMPPARDAATPAARADVVDQGTARLATMENDLRALVIRGTEREAFVRQWVDDFGIYLADRTDYTARLRADPTAEFLETVKYETQISKSLNAFAAVNKMESCQTPGDV